MANQQNEWTVSEAIKPFFLTFSFILVSLVYTSFPNGFGRFIALPCVSVLAGAAFFNSSELFPDSYAEEIYLRFVIIFLAYFSFLTLRNERTADGTSSMHNGIRNPPRSPWLRGYKLLFNSRGVGTSWELPYLLNDLKHIESIPNPKTAGRGDSKRLNPTSRSRWSGVALRCGYLVLNYLVLCIYYEYVDLAGHVKLRPSDTIQAKESIVRRAIGQCIGMLQETPVTRRELIVRVWTVFDLIVPDYLILSAYHDFFAMIFIAVGLDESWEWPPLFGPITEAYNMRRYWSIFWHRLIYKSFNAYAAAVLSLLGQKRRTLTSQLLRNFLVFAFSAAMHGVVSWKLGNECAFGRNLIFWLLQPVAFVMEGFVVSFWRNRRIHLLIKISPIALAAFERLVGYIWVFVWLFWSAPKGRLPMLFCGRK